MLEKRHSSPEMTRAAASTDELLEELFEEFAITELEDRLEFAMKCDNNCGCGCCPCKPE